MRAHLGALLLATAAALAATPAFARADEPMPRFEDAICPGVAGLSVDAAEYMVGRIRQNAEALGRRMAPADSCKPNIIVAFVTNGQSIIEAMNRDGAYVFSDLAKGERDALLSDSGPAHVVSRVVARTRDGQPVYGEANLTSPPQAYMWMAHSKIYTATQRNIVHALVLIDQAAMRGMSIEQLADYVTIRAFVNRPPAPGKTGADSILALFTSPANARPAGLTAYDRALLDTLYEGVPNLSAEARIAAIERATGRAYPRDE